MKKYLFSIVLLFVIGISFSQNVFWAKSAAGSDLDEGNGIAVDGSGNTYITGRFESPTLNFGLASVNNSTTADYTDVFIAKFDASGNCLWARSAGGSTSDYGAAIAVDNNGNAFITGYFTSPTMNFDGTTITNSGYDDIFIAKYNSSGGIQWAKAVGGNYEEEGTGISCDATGNVYITGNYYSASMNFGTETVTNNGGTDIFIAKFSSSGTNVWAKGIGGTDNEYGYAIKTDAGGNSYFTGYYDSPSVAFGITILTNSSGDHNLFVSKYDINGNAMWAESASSTSGSIMANGISADGSGNCYVAGTLDGTSATIGTSTMTNTHPGYDNTFTAKYNSNGNPQWAVNSTSGPEGNEAYCISSDNSGNCYISGWFTPPSVTFGTIVLNGTSYGDNIFLVKYNSSGQVQNAYGFAGSGLSGGYGNAISCDNSGNAFLTGYFEGTNMIIGTTTLINTNSSTWDVYWTKIAPGASGISEVAGPNELIFPNPCSDVLYISDADFIKIIDITGKTVLEEKLINSNSLDISAIHNGMYYIMLSRNNNSYYQKLIVE
jgi:hypothetical protein